jgi:hypothetical protein
MKTNFFILTFFLWLSSTAQDIWTTSYGGYNYDQPYALCKTADGGTLTAGYTNSSDVFVTGNHGFTDILLLKYDASGQFVWQKCYGGSINEAALDILPMADGSYCLVGRNQSFDGDCTAMYGETDVWVIRINENGDLLWQKSFGGTLGEFATSVVATEDNGILFAGGAFSSNAPLTDQNGQGDMWLVKIDALGTIIWSNCFGSTAYDSGTIIRKTQDGNFIFIGGFNVGNNEITVNSHGATDALVVKMSPDGTILWQQAYGGSQNDLVEEVIELPDGSLVVAGDSRSSNGDLTSTNAGLTDFWIFRIDANGTLLWSKNYGSNNSDYVRGLIQLNDGNIAFVGETQGVVNGLPLLGTSDVYIGLLDLNGNVLFEDIWGGSNFDYASDVILDTDGQLLITGYSWSNDNAFSTNNGYTDAYLLKYQIQQEFCNAIDDDNDGQVDEFIDWDGDGLNACNGDCNESDPLVNANAVEICNFEDENCNGSIDEGIPSLPYYVDADSDNFGYGNAIGFCADPGIGYAIVALDCDDTNPNVNPNELEILENGIDDDCNGDTGDTGVDEINNAVMVYPNPVSSGMVNIQCNQLPASGIMTISDSQGRFIRNEFIYSLQSEIETASLATGLYFFQMNHIVVRVYVNNNE